MPPPARVPVLQQIIDVVQELLGTPEKIQQWLRYWCTQAIPADRWGLPQNMLMIEILSSFRTMPNFIITGTNIQIFQNPLLAFPLDRVPVRVLQLLKQITAPEHHVYFEPKEELIGRKKTLIYPNFSFQMELAPHVPSHALMIGFLEIHLQHLHALTAAARTDQERRLLHMITLVFLDIFDRAYQCVVSAQKCLDPDWKATHTTINSILHRSYKFK